LHDATGYGSKTVQAHVPVTYQGCAPEQLGKLTGGRAPKQIHLKKAILSVEKAEGSRDIHSVGTANRWDTEVVALHANGGRKSCD
jgi:hypothetical protein